MYAIIAVAVCEYVYIYYVYYCKRHVSFLNKKIVQQSFFLYIYIYSKNYDDLIEVNYYFILFLTEPLDT